MAGNYNLGTALGRIVIDGAGAELGFGVAQQAGKQFFDAIDNQLKALRDFGTDLLKAGAVGAGGFALAGNAAANFEQRLSAVRAVSGASADDMARISAAALQIGKDTSFSATEAASAFEELVKAGISVQDTLDGAALATANLAAAGEISLPRAAEIAANAMNNFSLKGADMPRIADLVAGAANASAISVEEFAQSLAQTGAAANLAGLSFDDTAVAIAEMGNAGIKGSDAGTSLKTMLLNLQPVTQAQINKFEELGLSTFSSEKALKAMAKDGIAPIGSSMDDVRASISNYLSATQGIKNDTKEMGKAVDDYLQSNGAMQNAFFTTEGKVKKLADLQEVLKKATAGMTQEQKLANLETLFGADAIRAAAIMSKNGADGFNQLAGAMGNVTAAGTAATRLDNVKGSIEKLKGSVETLLIQLGMIFLPTIKKIVDKLTEFVDWLIQASDRAKTFFVSLGAVGTGLALVLGGLAVVAAAVGPWIIKIIGIAIIKNVIMGVVGAVKFLGLAFIEATGPISFFRILLGGLAGVFTGVAASATAAADAVGFFGKVAAFALGPWGLLIKIVLILIGIGFTLYQTWKPFKDLVDGIASTIDGVFNTAVQGLIGIVKKLEDGFHGVRTESDPLSKLLFAIGQAAAVIWTDLQNLWAIIQADLVPALDDLWNTLQKAFGQAFTDIAAAVQKDLIPALKELYKAFVTDMLPALKDFWKEFGPIIKVVLELAVVLAGWLLKNMVTFATILLGTIIPAILHFTGTVLGGLIKQMGIVSAWVIKYLITPLVDFVTYVVGTVIPAIGDFIASVKKGFEDGVKAVTGWIDQYLVKPIQGFIEWLTGSGKKTKEGSSSLAGGIQKGIEDVQKWVDKYLVKPFRDFVDGLIKIKDDTVKNLEAVAAVFAVVFKPVIDVVKAIVRFIGAVFLTIGKIIGGIWDFVFKITSAVWGFIFAVIKKAWEGFVGWFTEVMGGFINWWNEVWGGFGNWVKQVWDGFISWIMQVWGGFMGWLGEVMGGFANWWNEIWGGFGNWVKQVWDGFVAWIQEIWGGFMNWIGAVIGDFVTMWNIFWAFIGAYVKKVWEDFIGGIKDIWNGFVGWITDGYNALDRATGGGISRAVATFKKGWDDLVQGAKDIWDGFVGWLNGIPGQIKDLFNGASDWLLGAGGKIIDGLLGGLRGAADDVKNFFQNLTANIPNWKGPEPVDKVLLFPAGQMIIQSLVEGLDSDKDKIKAMLNGITAEIPATVNAALDPGLQSMINGQFNGKSSFSVLQPAPVVNVAPAKVTANFDARLFLGNKDITDLVDIRVNEHFDEVSSLIGTGVNG